MRDALPVLRADGISDELWALIEPVLPAGGHQGRAWNDHRLSLPDHFGAWQSIWERHRRWADDGTHLRIFTAVRAAAPERDEQLRNLHDAHPGDSVE